MYVVQLAFGSEPERLAARPAHRELLAQLYESGTLVMSGPFADDSGALLILDVPDEAALDQLIQSDPYFHSPGVKIVLRQEWTPLFGGR